jgi:hypothetical protein
MSYLYNKIFASASNENEAQRGRKFAGGTFGKYENSKLVCLSALPFVLS